MNEVHKSHSSTMGPEPTSTLLKTIGKNVHYFRERKSWTQARLAHIVECGQSTISGIESASLNPRLAILERIALSLGVEPWKLFVTSMHESEFRHLPHEFQAVIRLIEAPDPQLVRLGEDLMRLIADHLRMFEKNRRRGRPRGS